MRRTSPAEHRDLSCRGFDHITEAKDTTAGQATRSDYASVAGNARTDHNVAAPPLRLGSGLGRQPVQRVGIVGNRIRGIVLLSHTTRHPADRTCSLDTGARIPLCNDHGRGIGGWRVLRLPDRPRILLDRGRTHHTILRG